MTFVLLPAVDVADGRSVRLLQGASARETGHADPLDAARTWQAQGACWIHLVDIDAAFGRGSNASLLADVIERLDVDVELSGGIRDDASLARALATGCTRVVVSTAALADPGWCTRAIDAHGDRLAFAPDVRIDTAPDGSTQHRLAARGGTGDGGDLWTALEWLDRAGCARYVVTDVSADGALRGPNLALYRAVVAATAAPVIASGGISAITDLVELAELAASESTLEGAIVGAALHAGRFTLPEALGAVA